MTPNIDIFQWNDKYETGIALIDQQHQQLVALLNQLINHLAQQTSYTELNAIFDNLKNYAIFHFQTEEAIWKKYFQGDSWETEHIGGHNHFMEEVTRLRAEENQKSLDDVIANIVSFLTPWLAYHILDDDKRIARAVLEIQNGQTLEQAKSLANEQMSGATKVLIDTLMVMSNKLAQRTVQLTREIIQRQKLQEALDAANRAKSEFLANMSHEIRTPLNAITGMVYLLQREEMSPSQKDKLKKIDISGKHLLGIINDILDLTKIEVGKLNLESREINIANMVENVAAILSDRAKEKNLKLIVENEYLPEFLLGDPTRLQQCLLNYANNAIKFTDTGSVTLRTRKLEDNNDTMLLRFETEDTGIGINPDSVSRLFTAFEQADISTTRTHGGTGLGLAINKSLAQLMGGDVGVKSTPGVGSTFWLSARLKKAETPLNGLDSISAEPAAEVLRRDYAGQPVLVVEDEPLNREIAQMILEDVGLAVETAENGEEAVAKVANKRYRLILMDMQMPIMDGLEATRKIRQLPEGMDIPILAMTANAFVEDKRNCFESGMNDFIDKPVLPEILFDTLLKWLSGHP